ncbi:GNAT family N-acetyltransferase [Carnobacteriaceae bacterium zg-ZUI252]|nr:GNAT family N-acetyltransferase [Carnobacteriaceae bacterium zg-ZUI252]
MLRLATFNDMPILLKIIDDAIAYLKSSGVNQWQDGYPNESVLRDDIEKQHLYVMEHFGKVVGMSVIQTLKEDTYDTIEGRWLTQGDYVTVHRCAIEQGERGKQLGKQLFLEIEKYVESMGIHSIKIDTHEDNQVMQQLLKTLNYTYCGIIYLNNPSQDARLAYEKVLKNE